MKLPLGGRTAVMRSLLLATLLATLLAAGCSSSGGSTPPATAAGQKVTLQFWSWVPNLDKVVAIWNKAHPDIQVQLQVQAGGDAELTKLLTAAKAGNPPDIAQVEYQVLPTLVSSNYLADISKYAAGLSSDFPAGIWNQVTLGTSAVYGIPQDAAPMAFFYRPDLFTKYHLTVPATWAQFAADAKKLHAEAPGVYLGTFSSADPGEFAGLAQQAGAQWWSSSGTTWKVNIDSAASKQVFSFWESLVASGGVNNQPQWTAAWNKGMNDGQYIAWVSDVWAPTDMPTVSPANAGKWQMTPLPQWTSGATASGNWGGSSTGVMAASKHQQQAAEFATWLNTSPAATAALASVSGVYPADIAAERALSTPPAYFANQPSFWTLASQLAAGTSQVTWGPDVNVAYGEFTTAFGAAATSKGSFLAPLTQVQSTVVNDMKKSGFTVQAG
ncbi:MAG TPA: extracellular solute-binding protein [Streptosporangiaceae bacterium]|nr:extracellular solute-binding protein [Streptosporangiaceae bacterium]